MAKEAKKQEKAVKKVGKAVKRAVDKGVSAEVLTDAVERVLTETVDIASLKRGRKLT